MTSDGGTPVTERGVCWNTSNNPTIANNKSVDNYFGVRSFASFLTPLIANTTYYVRAYAINSAGISYGNVVSFTTLGGFILNDQIYSLASDAAGNIYRVGRFSNISGKMYIKN